ncbi:amidase [Microbacterium sp. SORGH_AS_0888]|uniref:amidase n=1 Tax=Microbacterium sp. SORGH_AS_0888 TaxID=3041791 RepID=UPI00278A473C|nr:amidase [Microbacterium sp. SORGH_AS_0888]MDQ1128099.1 amidase [Microbacterium sp. SORGH_AS_0888]
MAVSRPTKEDVKAFAHRFRYQFDESEFDQLHEIVVAGLAGYDVVDELYAAHIEVEAPRRDSRYPDADENPLGAWYVRTEIAPTSAGVLDGRTVAIKDNVAVAGVPMMNGSRTLEGFVPREDATVVTRVLAAGATILGKAVCEDLCFSGSSFTSASGPVHNPWDLARTTGGSSSGNAALVATGEVDLAVGGDQGGSVRLPASFTGIVGHKPTFGLVPYTGAFPIERTIDHLGPMARTVEDAALLLSVLAGPDGLDPRQTEGSRGPGDLSTVGDGVAGLRIGLLSEGFGIPGMSDPEVDALVTAAAEALAADGATVTRISVPAHTYAGALWGTIASDGATYQMLDGNGYGLGVPGYYDPHQMEYFSRGKREHADALADTVKVTALTGAWGLRGLGGSSYAKAQRLVPFVRDGYDAALAEVDVLVLPTTPFTALPLLEAGDDRPEYLRKALSMIANTSPQDVTGHPATSVPVGLASGLPVGLMVVAPRFNDALGLRVAAAVQAQRGPLTPPALVHHA